MGKQQAETMPPAIADEALRRQVACWVREALGELVEDDDVERDQAVAASLALRYTDTPPGFCQGGSWFNKRACQMNTATHQVEVPFPQAFASLARSPFPSAPGTGEKFAIL